jgi:hypothetical protein
MAKLDAKTIAAWTALVTTLAGGVELRMKVQDVATRLEKVERLVEERTAVASTD